MAVKTVNMSLNNFVKEAAAFSKSASQGFGIPVLYVMTLPGYGRLTKWISSFFILVDPAPPVFGPLVFTKEVLDSLINKWRLSQMGRDPACLMTSRRLDAESEWTGRIASIVKNGGVKFIFIDDASALPSSDFLERWSEELTVTVIVRKG